MTEAGKVLNKSDYGLQCDKNGDYYYNDRKKVMLNCLIIRITAVVK